MMQCSVSILLIWGAVTIMTSGASYPPRRYHYGYHYRSFGENRCSEEVAEIRDDIRMLKSLVESVRQKLEPYFKLTTVNEDLKDAVPCPEGFEYLSEAGGCYKVIMEKHKWSSAMTQCQRLNPNAHLIAIESHEESEAVTKYLNKKFASLVTRQKCPRTRHSFGDTAFWTSGHRNNVSACSSEFVWKTSTKKGETAFTYTQWNTGEPNCFGGDEKCVEMKMFGNSFSVSSWNDVNCDEVNRCPICEYAVKSNALLVLHGIHGPPYAIDHIRLQDQSVIDIA